jgi:hypothetical protein
MTPADTERVLRFLAMFHAVSSSLTTEDVRRAIAGPFELDDIPVSVPWPLVETILRTQPAFLDKDPARRLAWDLRDSDPLARIRLTKALIDAADNQTLGPVDLLGPDLRALPGLVERLLAATEDIADILSDGDFPPLQKQHLLHDLLATI